MPGLKRYCGKCGDEYHPSQGGWSHGRRTHLRYPLLRDGAKEDDPLHDWCYKEIYNVMVHVHTPANAQVTTSLCTLQRAEEVEHEANAPAEPPPLEPYDDDSANSGRPPHTADTFHKRFRSFEATDVAFDRHRANMTLTGGAGPLTAEEQAALAALLRRQFGPTTEPLTALPSSNGRDFVVAHLRKPIIGSADAKSSSVRERSAVTEKVLTALSVPDDAASTPDSERHLDAQRESLVKRATPQFKAAVEKVTGVSIGRPFTVDEELELKKHCGYVFGGVSPLCAM
jgi:hypothetical protein